MVKKFAVLTQASAQARDRTPHPWGICLRAGLLRYRRYSGREGREPEKGTMTVNKKAEVVPFGEYKGSGGSKVGRN